MRFTHLCFFAAAMALSSCQSYKFLRASGNETVSSTAFKTEIPFTFPQNQSILIPVYFEKEKANRLLKFDNHAPFTITTAITNNNSAFKKVGRFFIDKPTPEGKSIPNIGYLTDSVRLGSVQFNRVFTNVTPNQSDTASVKYDGVFGKNLMKKGIWKIDFEHHILTMTNSIDSIDAVKNAQKLPVTFSGTGKIKMAVVFKNNVKSTLELDLGYNGGIVLPKKNFNEIDVDHKAVIKKTSMTSVAGTQEATFYILYDEPIKIGINIFPLRLVTTETVNMKLLGLSFFSQFKFVIFDYLNKAVYVSNEKMP
jgi:hypothetical protein